MFDSHYHTTKRVTEYSNISVTEKRAPTDESVRLLKEMEQAARDKVLESIKLENNLVSAIVHKMYEPLSYRQLYAVLVKINGKDHRIDLEFDELDVDTYEKLAHAIYEGIAKQMTAHLMSGILGEIWQPKFGAK